MNKTDYKHTFSKIHPSDETVERIMDMTNKKRFTKGKSIIACMAAIALLICTMGVIANAATDGAVTQTIADAAESLSKKVYVFVNGEKTEAELTVEEHTDADGNSYYTGEVSITTPDSDTADKIEIELEGEEGDAVYGAGEIDIVLTDNLENAFIPTTAAE